MSEPAVPPMRKADFWSSLVLIALSAAMLLHTLTFPLRGTYAGVRNAWYVSPALFPLIVSATLIVLGLILLARSARTGAAAAAVRDLRAPVVAAFLRQATAFWIVGGLLGAYVYGFIPYVDFVAATALFLLCFTVGFHLADLRAGGRLVAALVAAGAALLMGGLLGLMPGPRTAAAYALDGIAWAGFVVAAGLAFRAARHAPEARRRFRQCFLTSLVTAFVVGVVFKYGLLVPLPREGLTVALMDPVFYALRAAL